MANVTANDCEREAIHLPGSIQPFGALVTYAPATGTVLHASLNLDRWLPGAGLAAAGGALVDLLGDAANASVEQALAGLAVGSVRHHVVDLPARPEHGQPVALQAVVHANRGMYFAEFEPATPAGEQRDWLQALGDTVDALRSAADLDDLVERTAQRVKRLTRFDRVMIYRFDPDQSGHVIADAREPGMESFYDLHYPASDIPPQARELYRGNLVRYIADVGYRPVSVVARCAQDSARLAPLDLSHAMLRSVSPIHLQYMQNMGVASTLTISLLIEDRLWGLIACHHRAPTAVPLGLRRVCHALALSAGFMFASSEQRQRAAAGSAALAAQAAILEAFGQPQVLLADAIEHSSAALLRITGAIGGALWRDGAIYPFGQWPLGARGDSILQYLRHEFETAAGDLVDTDRVSLRPPLASDELHGVCGLMALKLDRIGSSGLVWIRPESRREVAWGGDPDKPMRIEIDSTGTEYLTPRASFARWQTVVDGCCRPWTGLDRSAARTMLSLGHLLEVRASLAQVSLSVRQLRSLVALQSDAYWQMDARRRLVALSKPLFAGQDGVLGKTIDEVFAPYCSVTAIEALVQALHGRQPFRALRMRGWREPDRRQFDLLINGEPMRDQHDGASGWHGTITDVTREVALQTSLQRREAEQQAMLDNDLVGIIKMRDRRIVWKNKAMDRIFGFGPDELYGETSRIIHIDDDAFASAGAAAERAMLECGRYRDQLQMTRKDGGRLWIDANGALLSAPKRETIWVLADITLLKQAQDQLQDIAFHDGLTGLPNRLLLIDRLEQALEAARRHQRSLAVCYVDLDGFKRINDEFGHAAGDRLLKEVALRLAHAVRANDTVCRLGGDEFIILLTELGSAASCQELLQRVIEDLERPFDLDGGRQARLSASIGVAIFPGDGEQPETLINNADRAMYDAKKLGLHRVCMFGAPAPIALAAATA